MTGGKIAVPLGVDHVRKLALGADAVRLSRKLSTTELNSLLAEVRADASVQYVQVDRMMRAIDNIAAPASVVSSLAAAAGISWDVVTLTSWVMEVAPAILWVAAMQQRAHAARPYTVNPKALK